MQRGYERGALCKICIGASCIGKASSPTGARSVGNQVDAEYEVQSYSAFRHEADSSVTESPRAYLWKFTGVLLQLSQFEGSCLVGELRSILQRVDPGFSTLREVWKTQKHCYQKMIRQNNGDVMDAPFERKLVDVETVPEIIKQSCTKRLQWK